MKTRFYERMSREDQMLFDECGIEVLKRRGKLCPTKGHCPCYYKRGEKCNFCGAVPAKKTKRKAAA